MMFYPCKKKTPVTRNKVVTKEGKFALDAVENNPNIEGSLANLISMNSNNINEIINQMRIDGYIKLEPQFYQQSSVAIYRFISPIETGSWSFIIKNKITNEIVTKFNYIITSLTSNATYELLYGSLPDGIGVAQDYHNFSMGISHIYVDVGSLNGPTNVIGTSVLKVIKSVVSLIKYDFYCKKL